MIGDLIRVITRQRIRALSNKPDLVVAVESPASEARMREMFAAVDGVLRTHLEVGEYDQTI